jgi:predicted Zn-dependent protease with MMP-like domain
VIEYVDMDNRKSGYPERPFKASPSRKFMTDIQQAFKELPEAVKKQLNKKLAGVFLINDLGTTGFTDDILDENGNQYAGYIILDAGVLKDKTANAWSTWKESTPFKQGEYRIESIIEHKENNDRKNAIQYILLHELGHVLAIKDKIHPHWGKKPKEIKNFKPYEFFHHSWRPNFEMNVYDSIYDKKLMPERRFVRYYWGAKLTSQQMMDLYNKLEKTNFPTLYAVTNPMDDWASPLYLTCIQS